MVKSLLGNYLAHSVKLGIESDKLIAVMHDRASVNRAAMCTVHVVYPTILDIGCTSHTLDIVEDKFQVSTLHLFFTLWISLFSHSRKVKALWKERTGQAMSSCSNTRWWSHWEVRTSGSTAIRRGGAFLEATQGY